MGKFDGILICTDFDGTLAQSARVSPENAVAIRYFEENGGLFTISSGRHPIFANEHIEGFEVNAPITGYNGAIIYDPHTGAYLHRGGRSDGLMFEVLEEILAREPAIERLSFHYEGGEAHFKLAEMTREAALAAAREQVKFPYYNTLCCTSGNRAVAMRERVSRWLPAEFAVRCSWSDGMELICRGDEKGDAMVRLKEMTGARLLIGVGNYENDMTLLTQADIGYAVADAEPSVLAVADRVTVSCAEHAIAAIIRDLEEAN